MVISKQGKTISDKKITAIVERKKPERATSLIQVMLLLVFSINVESGHLIDLVTAMNIVLHPFLAGLEGYSEAMNRLDFAKACGAAGFALLLAFLPKRWRVNRVMGIGFALASIYWVMQLVRLNDPQWQPVWVLMWPVLVSLAAIGLSLRTLLHRPK